jgi:hypothetical protein
MRSLPAVKAATPRLAMHPVVPARTVLLPVMAALVVVELRTPTVASAKAETPSAATPTVATAEMPVVTQVAARYSVVRPLPGSRLEERPLAASQATAVPRLEALVPVGRPQEIHRRVLRSLEMRLAESPALGISQQSRMGVTQLVELAVLVSTVPLARWAPRDLAARPAVRARQDWA